MSTRPIETGYGGHGMAQSVIGVGPRFRVNGHGVAAIPTAALDPPHSAASPAVPALIGSGSPSAAASNDVRGRALRHLRCGLLHLGDPLELGQDFRLVLGEVAHDAGVAEQFGEITAR